MAAKKITTKRRLFLGIDPGRKGYFCAIDERGRVARMIGIPYLEKQVDATRVLLILNDLKRHGLAGAILEKQQPFRGEGVGGAFSLGFNFGVLKTALLHTRCRFEVKRPQDWKREMSIPVPSVKDKKKRKKLIKELSIRKAQEFRPDYDFRTSRAWNAKPSDGKCEAFLMAELARRNHLME